MSVQVLSFVRSRLLFDMKCFDTFYFKLKILCQAVVLNKGEKRIIYLE